MDETTTSRTKRSTQSCRFEAALRGSVPGVMTQLADIDYGPIRDLVPWVAIVDPDKVAHTVKFTRAGAGVASLIGRDAVGFDYLNLVDDAIKGEAFDSCFVMLTRPCGLWQKTPVTLADGQSFTVEYTGFPVFDVQRGRGQIVFLIVPSLTDVGKASRVGGVLHSTDWHWIELRS